MDSLGDIWKIIYLGFEKSQCSVTHDSLRYINILTYLLTDMCPQQMPAARSRCKDWQQSPSGHSTSHTACYSLLYTMIFHPLRAHTWTTKTQEHGWWARSSLKETTTIDSQTSSWSQRREQAALWWHSHILQTLPDSVVCSRRHYDVPCWIPLTAVAPPPAHHHHHHHHHHPLSECCNTTAISFFILHLTTPHCYTTTTHAVSSCDQPHYCNQHCYLAATFC